MKQLFSNFSWTDPNLTIAQKGIVDNWTTYRSGIFAHLPSFIAYNVSGYAAKKAKGFVDFCRFLAVFLLYDLYNASGTGWLFRAGF